MIAGGSFDGDGALGVAWDAEFLFLDHVYPSIAFTDLVSQIAYARDQEAVVINNRWGFKGNEFNDPLVAKASLAGIASAYESFQDVGVVVFARSNARQLGPDHPRSQYLSDLPDLFPELQDAWISAINAKFHESSVDGSLYVVERQSSACGKSAAWCLVGSGDAMAANSWGDYTNYLTGSSFVAPQISGAIALLAEAFPDLSPAEWTARLLASANNSWFADSGSTVVNEAGELLYDPSMLAERCWNNNAVCHTYSTEWGHGVMDMQAALSPIGGLSLLAGETIQSGGGIALNNATIGTSSFMMQGLGAALDMSIALFDGLGTNFSTPAAGLVTHNSGQNSAASRLLTRLSGADLGQDFSFQREGRSYSGAIDHSPNAFSVDYAMQSGQYGANTVIKFGYSSNGHNETFGGIGTNKALGHIGFSGLMEDVVHVAIGRGADESNRLMVFAFDGGNSSEYGGPISGMGTRLSRQWMETQVEFATTLAFEQDSFLGASDQHHIWFDGATAIGAGQLALRRELGSGWQFTSRPELGLVEAYDNEGGLIDFAKQSYYSGFDLELEKL